MNITWDVDPATRIELVARPFKKATVLAGGRTIASTLRLGRKGAFKFALADGRRARIEMTPTYGSTAEIRLTVDGELMVPTTGRPFLCKACGAMRQPNDKFCESCGAAAPPPGQYFQADRVAGAASMIWVIAALYAAGGVLMYFITKSHVATLLQQLAAKPGDLVIPTHVAGPAITVAMLRERLTFEPASVLIENGILVTIMVALALWARRSPLPAIIVAAAIYGVVILIAALQNPATLAQGLAVKFVMIVALYRGVRAALEMRTAKA